MRSIAILLLFAALPWSARCQDPARAMVIAGDRQAAEAGLRMLQAGGSVADAAVAVLMVLTVTEPQAAGIGGGAVLLHFDHTTHAVTAWDGWETAPAAAIAARSGDPAHTGGQTVGVPGAVRMLEAVHHDHGKLPWADLLAPAIQLAEHGAPVSRALAQAIAAAQTALRPQPGALAVFFTPAGVPLAADSAMTNPALAQTLHAIAVGGANGLLRGPIAADIASAVRGDPQPGLLTTDDLAAYVPRRREPACVPIRAGIVCSTPPPAGGLLLLQTLALLDHIDLATLPPGSADAVSALIEAGQLAAANAARYLADPDYWPVPLAGLLSDAYLTARARQIDPNHAIKPESGSPSGSPSGPEPYHPEPPPLRGHATSSVVIVDAQGDALCMTASLSAPFGARLFVHGFMLNAALADFSPVPPDPAAAPANQIQPGKRPASAASPAIVLGADHALLAVIGSGGGALTPSDAAQTLAGLLFWRMNPAAAVAMPHIATDLDGVVLEADTPAAALEPALAARGYEVGVAALPSATALYVAGSSQPTGTADERGQGFVASAPALPTAGAMPQ